MYRNNHNMEKDEEYIKDDKERKKNKIERV